MLDAVGLAGVDVETAGADVVLEPETVEERRAHGNVDGELVHGVVAEDADRVPGVALEDVVNKLVEIFLDVGRDAGQGGVAFLVGNGRVPSDAKEEKSKKQSSHRQNDKTTHFNHFFSKNTLTHHMKNIKKV